MRDALERRETGFAEKLDRAREQIRALGGDWTAEEVSDPGLAALEALTWASVMQENRIKSSAETSSGSPPRRNTIAGMPPAGTSVLSGTSKLSAPA